VVVETIDFYNDEDDGLPPPQSLTDVIAQLRATTVDSAPVQTDDGAMDVEMDEEERAIVAEGAQPLPTAPEPQMKIVRNYKPPGAARTAANTGQMVVSPITGELVPIQDIAEHMRISLIDPKWRKEREAMLGKLRGSTSASDEEIARNVVSLARTRPDIFGSTDQEVSVALSAEMERGKADERAASAVASLPPPPSAAPLMPPAVRPLMPAMPPPVMPWGAPGMPPVPGYMPPIPGYGYPPAFPPTAAPHFQPPMGMMGMPLPMPPGMAPPPGPPPPPTGDDQEAKRQRVEDTPALMSEEDFAEANQGPIMVRVALPEVEGDAQLRGQTVELEMGSVMETIGDVKARLASVVGVPSSKQKMSTAALGFLKDTSTLAAYNFGMGTQLAMGLKERGGRTKK
jgi:splicing factor 3A subunit 1